MLPFSMKDMLLLLTGESGNLRYQSLSHLNRAVPPSARTVPFLFTLTPSVLPFRVQPKDSSIFQAPPSYGRP